MRIGIDIRALMEGKVTGVQVYILNLLATLFRIDQENHYLLFANAWRRSRGSIGGFENHENVTYKVFGYPNKIFSPAQKFLSLPKIDRLLGGVDLFFSPHWRVVALSDGVPLIVTFHDLSFEFVPEFFTLKQRYWHGFMNYRRAAGSAQKIIAVSDNTANDLEKIYRVSRDKIIVIYPGANKPQDIPIKQNERKYFLYFGTFEPRKNIQAVLVAYQDYLLKSRKKMGLVLAGSSGWKTKVKIPNQLRGMVKIYQNVDEEQKDKLYRGAFAFLFVSYYEGFGFPMLEAASHGLPVIASASTSLLEIGRDFALFVNPFRTSQIAGAMTMLEHEPEFYDKLKHNGQSSAAKFSWENTARKTLKLFEEFS